MPRSSACSIRLLFTFVDQVLGLQVEALAVTLPPQPGDGGVKLPAAVGLHGGRGGHEVPLLPDERSGARAAASPLRAPLQRHLERQVVARNVDVARVVPLVGVVLTPLPVPPGVGLVPVIGADRHGEEPERAERQEEPCARQDFHSGHLPRSTESPETVTRRCLRGRGGAGTAREESHDGTSEPPAVLRPEHDAAKPVLRGLDAAVFCCGARWM